jgi:hypothetical protein
MACPQVVDGRNGLQLWRVAANTLRTRRQLTRGGPPAWGLGVMKILKEPRTIVYNPLILSDKNLQSFTPEINNS